MPRLFTFATIIPINNFVVNLSTHWNPMQAIIIKGVSIAVYVII